VKLVAIKLKKNASIWWEHLKKQRAHEERSRIVTSEKMRQELKKKFLLPNYHQDTFLQFHNFKQKELFVEEHTAEFDHLMMVCDVSEGEEQTITRYLGGLYLGGLQSEIDNVIQVQPY